MRETAFDRMAAAAAAFMGPRPARDLAAHVAMWEVVNDALIAAEIRRRMRLYAVRCGDVDACARAMFRAWNVENAPHRVGCDCSLSCEIRGMRARHRAQKDDDEVVVGGVRMSRRRARETGVLPC